MSSFSFAAVIQWVRPWRVVAALLIATVLFLGRGDEARALTVTGITLNASGAGATSDLSIDIALDADLAPGDSITVTFPADSQPAATGTPWVVPAAVPGVSWAGLIDLAPVIASNAGARTITTTIAAPQIAALPLTLTIPAGAGLTNPAAGGTYRITVAATGNVTNTFDVAITAGAITGGNVTLTPTTVGAQTAGTIAFTLPAALGNGNSIILTFPAG